MQSYYSSVSAAQLAGAAQAAPENDWIAQRLKVRGAGRLQGRRAGVATPH